MGPLLFLLFINDLPNASPILQFVLFADDSNIFFTHNSYEKLFTELNSELIKISEWFKVNKLSLNLTKTNYILFRSHRKPTPQIIGKIFIDTTEIPQVSTVKFLGLHVDQYFTWKNHIEIIASKIAKNIGVISRISYLIPNNTRLTLYYSLIYPYIAYCNMIWASNYTHRLQRIILLQKRILRIIAGSSWNAHTDPLFKHYRILKLTQIKQKQLNEFMHRYIFNTLPTNFSNLFTFSSDLHSYNIRNPSLVRTIFARTNSRRFSIRVAGPAAWNALPKDLQSIPNLNLF